jgi:hypothetical protein
LIQIDEPALLKHGGDSTHAERSLAAPAAAKGPAELAPELYLGDPAHIYDGLKALPEDVLALDLTYSPTLVNVVAISKEFDVPGLGSCG